MAAPRGSLQSPLLPGGALLPDAPPRLRVRRPCAALAIAVALLALAGVLLLLSSPGAEPAADRSRSGVSVGGARLSTHEVESGAGAVAADDGRCSEVGAAALRAGGHAVDAAVAAAFCLGVVHPMSSGIGGGAFIVVRNASSGEAVAFDARETAPAAATPNMYDADPTSKYKGALAMGVPGELAGLHAMWSRYGRLPWKSLLAPAITLARDGYTIVPYVANALKEIEQDVLADPGLRNIFAHDGKLLTAGELCHNPALADTLEAVAERGVEELYGGVVGMRLAKDVRQLGGVVTSEDLMGYRVAVGDAMEADAMGFTFLGMPPPSSGTVGMALVLNILGGYKSTEFLKGFLGVHRLIEAVKHMLAARMDLGDPGFVNVAGYVSEMLSPAFADKIRQRIADNTTFPSDYYLPRWRQLSDNGTSHLCVVDGDRNAVAMTTTVNSFFGAHVLSPSTGIVLNNEMDDFSVPQQIPDKLPPAPANFIAPGKRPLSSMTPTIILKDGQLAGVLGASGGTNIITAVTQVFLNHFVLGMSPLAAVQSARVYPQLGEVRGRDGERRRGHQAQPRGQGVFEKQGPCAGRHGVGGRVPDDRAGFAGASLQWRRRRERVPWDADGGERPEERRQPCRSVIDAGRFFLHVKCKYIQIDCLEQHEFSSAGQIFLSVETPAGTR